MGGKKIPEKKKKRKGYAGKKRAVLFLRTSEKREIAVLGHEKIGGGVSRPPTAKKKSVLAKGGGEGKTGPGR